jgi:hypothetical protein
MKRNSIALGVVLAPFYSGLGDVRGDRFACEVPVSMMSQTNVLSEGAELGRSTLVCDELQCGVNIGATMYSNYVYTEQSKNICLKLLKIVEKERRVSGISRPVMVKIVSPGCDPQLCRARQNSRRNPGPDPSCLGRS